jgi:AcrR family transcriptional regulator
VKKQALPKRDRTRRMILDAALAEFGGTSFFASTIDSICLRAGIVRATFYRYFDSKPAVAAALIDEMMEQVWQMYRVLAGLPSHDEAALAGWLTQPLDLAAKHRTHFVMIREINTLENHQFPWRARQRTVDIFAETLPCFRLAQDGPDSDPQLRALVYLTLMQFNEFLFATEILHWPDARPWGVQAMAKNLAAMFEIIQHHWTTRLAR